MSEEIREGGGIQCPKCLGLVAVSCTCNDFDKIGDDLRQGHSERELRKHKYDNVTEMLISEQGKQVKELERKLAVAVEALGIAKGQIVWATTHRGLVPDSGIFYHLGGYTYDILEKALQDIGGE